MRASSWVPAAEEAVAGVEQELCRRAGRGHEVVDLVRGLDDGAHVVVVGEGEALGGGEGRDGLDVGAELRPGLGADQFRAIDERAGVVAVDGV